MKLLPLNRAMPLAVTAQTLPALSSVTVVTMFEGSPSLRRYEMKLFPSNRASPFLVGIQINPRLSCITLVDCVWGSPSNEVYSLNGKVCPCEVRLTDASSRISM